MSKFFISYYSEDKSSSGYMGDMEGNPFDSERAAWDFLDRLHKAGDINLVSEEVGCPHGSRSQEYIECKDGKRYFIYTEEILKFNKEKFS